VEIQQIAPRLWWWTAPHPEWTPEQFKDGQGWERDVSSYALVEDDSLVLFDPLVPAGDEEPFWKALDGDVEHHGPPAVLITVFWHARSSREILDRYEGATLWSHEPSAAELAERVPVTRTFADGDVLPGRVEALALHHMNEAAFWLPSHRALVIGDSILGYEDHVRHCPKGWLREGESFAKSRAAVKRALNAKRPEQWLLLTHGGPRKAPADDYSSAASA
jgi:glyoxylase-like metal-dependent hydrolase (beta-lactamase superfamily II)